MCWNLLHNIHYATIIGTYYNRKAIERRIMSEISEAYIIRCIRSYCATLEHMRGHLVTSYDFSKNTNLIILNLKSKDLKSVWQESYPLDEFIEDNHYNWQKILQKSDKNYDLLSKRTHDLERRLKWTSQLNEH